MELAKNILVVEDEQLIALDIKHSLEESGYKVPACLVSGEDAVLYCKKSPPDLVLMDIKLKGGIDGIQAASEIGESRHIPIVFLTSFNDEDTLRRAKLTKPFGYLLKPFDRQELGATLASAWKQPSSILEPHALPFEPTPPGHPVGSAEGLDARISFLASHPLFADSDANSIAWLAGLAEERQFDVGEHIFTRTKPSESAFLVLSGRISLMRTSPIGKDLIVALLAHGDSFGMCYLISELGNSLSARAQNPSRLLAFPVSKSDEILARIPTLPRRIASHLALQLEKSYALASSLAYESVEDRILTALVTLISDFGKHADKPNESWIYITRKELADLTGTTPETAIRITKNLERSKLLDLTRPGIIKIPNVSALKALCGLGLN